MLRVLFLRRQTKGGVATYTNHLAEALEAHGIEVVIDDAETWIPNETGGKVDKQVNKLVQQAAKGFDMVHAFGYRPAWACSEAFYVRFPWVYTAYDMPKTTSSMLIDRLVAAKTGICVSSAVKKALHDADCVNLDMIRPGAVVPQDPPTYQEARDALGIGEDEDLVVAMGKYASERGLDSLAQAAEHITSETPSARIAIIGYGEGKENLPRGPYETHGDTADRWMWLSAADLVVIPSRRAGFSMVGAEAMALGKPVLYRETGGLPEMGTVNVNIELFEDDDDLPLHVIELLQAPVHREAVGRSALIRAEEVFSMKRCAEQHATLYRDLLS